MSLQLHIPKLISFHRPQDQVLSSSSGDELKCTDFFKTQMVDVEFSLESYTIQIRSGTIFVEFRFRPHTITMRM